MLLYVDLAQMAEVYMSEFVTHVSKALKMETERGWMFFWNIGKTGKKESRTEAKLYRKIIAKRRP